MPVEIRELVIRATTRADAVVADEGAPEVDAGAQQDDLVQACVSEVLRVLRSARER